MPLDDCCRLVLPYNAVHSIQQTEQIPNDPPQMAAKSTTTSNHPSTPNILYIYNYIDTYTCRFGRASFYNDHQWSQ